MDTIVREQSKKMLRSTMKRCVAAHTVSMRQLATAAPLTLELLWRRLPALPQPVGPHAVALGSARGVTYFADARAIHLNEAKGEWMQAREGVPSLVTHAVPLSLHQTVRFRFVSLSFCIRSLSVVVLFLSLSFWHCYCGTMAVAVRQAERVGREADAVHDARARRQARRERLPLAAQACDCTRIAVVVFGQRVTLSLTVDRAGR